MSIDPIQAQLDAYRAEGRAQIEETRAVAARIDAYRAEAAARFDRLDARLDRLDAKVGAIALFGDES